MIWKQVVSVLFKIVDNQSSHRILELFEGDDSVTIGICLLKQILPENGIHFAAPIAIEMLIKVFDGDHVVLVGIKNAEGSQKITLIGKNSAIYTSSNKFLEVNNAVSIEITCLKDLVPVDIYPVAQLLEFVSGKSS